MVIHLLVGVLCMVGGLAGARTGDAGFAAVMGVLGLMNIWVWLLDWRRDHQPRRNRPARGNTIPYNRHLARREPQDVLKKEVA